MAQIVLRELSETDVKGLELFCGVCEKESATLRWMKIMLDIEDDAVYVNMTGQNPRYYQLFKNKRELTVR